MDKETLADILGSIVVFALVVNAGYWMMAL